MYSLDKWGGGGSWNRPPSKPPTESRPPTPPIPPQSPPGEVEIERSDSGDALRVTVTIATEAAIRAEVTVNFISPDNKK